MIWRPKEAGSPALEISINCVLRRRRSSFLTTSCCCCFFSGLYCFLRTRISNILYLVACYMWLMVCYLRCDCHYLWWVCWFDRPIASVAYPTTVSYSGAIGFAFTHRNWLAYIVYTTDIKSALKYWLLQGFFPSWLYTRMEKSFLWLFQYTSNTFTFSSAANNIIQWHPNFSVWLNLVSSSMIIWIMSSLRPSFRHQSKECKDQSCLSRFNKKIYLGNMWGSKGLFSK